MLANVRSAECANISQKPRSGRLFMQSGFAVLKPTNSTTKYASLPPKNELPDPIHQSSQGVSQFVLISRDAMPQFLGLSVLAVLSVPWLTGLRLTTPMLRPKRPIRPAVIGLPGTGSSEEKQLRPPRARVFFHCHTFSV